MSFRLAKPKQDSATPHLEQNPNLQPWQGPVLERALKVDEVLMQAGSARKTHIPKRREPSAGFLGPLRRLVGILVRFGKRSKKRIDETPEPEQDW
jgi:hypothetical protein